MIERRGALLRDQLHKTDTQLRDEGITLPFPQRLAEAVFAGNALLSISGHTAYQSLLGRTPSVLPQLSLSDAAAADTIGDDTSRQCHRLREISIQAVVAGTAA